MARHSLPTGPNLPHHAAEPPRFGCPSSILAPFCCRGTPLRTSRQHSTHTRHFPGEGCLHEWIFAILSDDEEAPLLRCAERGAEKLDLKNRPLDAFPNPSLPAALAAGPLPLTAAWAQPVFRHLFLSPLRQDISRYLNRKTSLMIHCHRRGRREGHFVSTLTTRDTFYDWGKAP